MYGPIKTYGCIIESRSPFSTCVSGVVPSWFFERARANVNDDSNDLSFPLVRKTLSLVGKKGI